MKIFVIGGGAAGMMAAIFAAQDTNASVTILERNQQLGRKLFITGKGRCNLTNLSTSEEYLDNIISNANFIRSSLYRMDAYSLVTFFNKIGLATKVERGNRVFPNSDKSNDVIKALSKHLKELGVNIIYNQKVIDLIISQDKKVSLIKTETHEFYPDRVIFATGGKSYSATGSDGLGYKILARIGHSIKPLKPALASILTENCYNAYGKKVALNSLPKLQGLSLKNVEAKIIDQNNKCLVKEFGEMLFTHNGLSGPIILTLSSKINRMPINGLKVVIDLKPAVDFNTLDNRLIREFNKNKNKFLKNSLGELLPSKLIPFIIELSTINTNLSVNSLTREQRNRLCNLLKGIIFEIKSLDDINNAIITSGGINTKEIDPKTMQSKLINNLYFAGEVIDIDALTGGYNLQIAFSTGCVAGINSTKIGE